MTWEEVRRTCCKDAWDDENRQRILVAGGLVKLGGCAETPSAHIPECAVASVECDCQCCQVDVEWELHSSNALVLRNIERAPAQHGAQAPSSPPSKPQLNTPSK